MICHSFFAQNNDNVQISEPLDSVYTADSINVPKSKSSIKHTINYDAVDSIWFDVSKQEATLFGKAHLDYDDVNVDGPLIFVNIKNSTLEAQATYDSTGKVIEWPFLKQKDDQFQAKTILFNWKTSRGYIEDVYMKEGEGFLYTKQAYLDTDKTMYIKDGSYTTCNLANPHYHFQMGKAKIIPEDRIIASRVNLYIDSIPTPLGLPYGMFPTKDKVSSGLLMPNDFGDNFLGFYLKGFGYFWAISDSLTTSFNGEIYSKGSYGISNNTNYKIRYKYAGNLNFNYRKVLNNSDELSRNSTNTIGIRWTHNPESRTGRKLISDVNYQSISYNIFNNSQTGQNSIPQINSSVTWTLPMRGIPFNASVSFKHNQNKDNGVNTFNLPNYTLTYSGERNPFKKIPYLNNQPSETRKKILDQISISYANSGYNSLSSEKLRRPTSNSYFELEKLLNEKDSMDLDLNQDNFKDLLQRNKFYMTHNATIQNNIKIKSFTLTPRFNYSEYWYFKRSEFEANFSDSTYNYSNINGFNRIARYNSDISLSAPFYNFYTLGRVRQIKNANDSTSKKIDRQIKFRHQIIPVIALSNAPDYSKDVSLTEIFQNGNQSVAFDRYFLYNGRPSSSGKSRRIKFELNNVFEMKTPVKKSLQMSPDYVAKPQTPLKLLQLNGRADYNLAADSLNLSNIVISASNTSLFGGLIGFTTNAVFDPYQYIKTSDNRIIAVNKFWFENNKTVARLKTLQLNSNLALKPGIFNRSIKKDPQAAEKNSYFQYPGYVDFNMPWTLNFNYNYVWDVATPFSDTSKSNTINSNGTLKLSDNWAASFGLNYNIDKKQFTNPSLSLNRDLHCWIMRIEWVPFGPPNTTKYSFFIGVKADMLKDLKYQMKNSPYDRVNF